MSDHRLDRSPDGYERALSEKAFSGKKRPNKSRTPPMKTPNIEVITPVTYQQEIKKPVKN